MKNLGFKVLLILLFASITSVKADHIMGSDITYRCSKSNDSIFTIIINFYRDCRGCYVLSQNPHCGTSEDCNSAGTVPSVLTITCESGGGGSSLGTVSMTRTSITDITKTCKNELSKCAQPCNGTYPYGIERHTFEGTIDMRKAMKSGCCRFRVSTAGICCRSVNITTGPSGSFYTYLEIDACQKPCNTSPQLTNDPVCILCCNQPYFFNNGAVDTVNFDSLSYSLVSSYASAGAKSNYTGGFSGAYPVTPYWPPSYDKNKGPNPNVDPPIGIFLDPETGDLIFTPTDCSQEAIVVMQIDEWRKNSKGVYENVGVTRRDMDFLVQICPENNPPKITNSTFKYSICAETQLCFDITTKDVPFVPPPPAKAPPPDTVTLTWNRAISGATFNIKNTKAREQVGTFCWTPKRNQASDLPYTFTATARDNACPKNAITTRSFSIIVKPIAETKRVVTKLICGRYTVESQLFGGFKTPAQYLWEVSDSLNKPLTNTYYFFKSNKGTRSTKDYDTVQFRKGGKYIIHHRINNAVNCPSDYFDTIIVPPLLEVDLALGPDTFVCKGTTLRLQSKVKQGVPSYKYQWFTPFQYSNKDTLTYIDVLMDNAVDSTFRIEILDQNKCTAFDTINIFLKKNPHVDMGNDKRICWYDSITITPDSKLAFWVDPATGDTLTQGRKLKWEWNYDGKFYSNDTFSRIAQEGIYTATVIDSLGCNFTDTFNLIVNDTIRPYAGPDQVKCFDDVLTLSGSGLDSTKKYQSGSYNWWKGISDFGAPLSTLKKFSFKVQTTNNYLLKLRIKEDTLTCFNYDTVQAKVNPLPVLTLIAPQKYCCDYGKIALGSTTFGSPVGGTWSCRQNAAYINSNVFLTDDACDPKKQGVFTLIYEYQDPATTCINKDSTKFTINPLPPIQLKDGFYCQDKIEAPLGKHVIAPVKLNAMVDVQWKLLRTLPKPTGGNNTVADLIYDKDASLNYDFWLKLDTNTIDIGASPRDSLILVMTIQDGQGCFAKDTMTIYIWKVPVISFNIFPPLCIDAGIVDLMKLSNVTPDEGCWTVVDTAGFKNKNFLQPGMIGCDSLNTLKLSLQNGPGLYRIRYTHTASGCPVQRDTNLRINPLPNVNLKVVDPGGTLAYISARADSGKFCEIDPDVSLSAAPAGGVWTSSIPGVLSGSKFKPGSVSAAERDKWIILTYTYIDPSTKCDTAKIVKVFVQSKPTVDIITPDYDTCRSNVMNFKLEASKQFTKKITWYHSADPLRASFENNGQSSILNPTRYTIRPRSDTSTTILITCITDAEGVCPFAQDFMNIRINPVPHANFSIDDPDGCAPHTINVVSHITNKVDSSKAVFTWRFGDNDSINTQNALHTYSKAGLYSLSLKISSDKGCDTLLGPLPIDVYPVPVADFTPNPNNSTTKALPRFRFTNESKVVLQNKIISNFWDFGDIVTSDTSSVLNPEYYYLGDTGVYHVSLLVVTEHGCRDSITKPVIIGPDILVYIPNVFTPDGAGPLMNDRFKIVASGVKTFQVIIFNRWGEKLFVSHSLTDSWDGTYNHELAQMDAYVYEVQVTSFSDKLYKYTGTVILAR